MHIWLSMPDFTIHLVNCVREELGTHFGDAEKNFIRNGVLDLFQRVAAQGKIRADQRASRGRRRSTTTDNPAYNIIVTWVDTPPASSNDYICYFVRTQGQSIIRRELRQTTVPEAQGLTTEINAQSISEVYIMDTANVRRQCQNEHLVLVVFHEFLHNRLEVTSAIAHPHDVHAEDPDGYGTAVSSLHVTGREHDDPTTVDDERFTIHTAARRDVVLTERFDIDLVYANLGNPVSQYIFIRPAT